MGFLGDTSEPNHSSESSYLRTLCQVIWSSSAQPQCPKLETSSSTFCLQSTQTNALNTLHHHPHTFSHHSGAPKSVLCDLLDLTSAWGRGAGETDTDVYAIDAQIIFLQNMSWCPVSCLALLSGSYCLFSLSPNFQFSTCLPGRTPTWDHIKREVGVGLQWGDHWACSVPRPTWGHL